MNNIVKWGLIGIGVALTTAILTYVGWMVAIAYAMGAYDKPYTKADLIFHYEATAPKLRALSAYINTIVPADKSVEIEFDGRRTIPIFHVSDHETRSSNWDVPWDSPKADTLLHTLGWTRQTLTTLQDRLDEAGCISITSGEPCVIGFQRSGMGKYSYDLFAHPLSDSLKAEYTDGCSYIFYRSNVVLEYGGGAIGPQCFPGEHRRGHY
ncbi:hypothetical protein GCM10027594_30570 [Hymenobacter agri]